MLRLLGALFALLLSASPAIAGTMVCRAPLYPDKNWSDVTRFLTADGSFSFETYSSESATGFRPTLWQHTLPSSLNNGIALQLEIFESDVRKLKNGSFIEISDEKGNRLETRQLSSKSRSFGVPLDTLFKTFRNSGSLTLTLINGRRAKKNPYSGKLNLSQLSKEAALIPAAQTRLNAMQADFQKQCSPLTEPDPDDDPANWSCANQMQDEFGDYYADGDSLSLTLRLGKVAGIFWHSNNSGLATLWWRNEKTNRSAVLLRFQTGNDIFEIATTLHRAKYGTSLKREWSLAEALQLKNDMLIQAVDDKGIVLEQVTLPKSTMEHAAKQMKLMQTQSIADRSDYKKRCEPPMEEDIIVT